MKITHFFIDCSPHHVIPFVQFIDDFIRQDIRFTHEVFIFNKRHLLEAYPNRLIKISTQVEYSNCQKRVLSKLNSLSTDHLGVIHGLYNRKIIGKLIFSLSKLKYIIWSIWGADLYSQHKKFLKRFRTNIYRKIVFPRIGTKIGQPGDYQYLKQKYGCKTEEFREILFPAWFYLENDQITLNERVNRHQSLCAIIGNSASDSNNHIELIDYLSRSINFSKFTFLLNYPKREAYVKKIETYAKKCLKSVKLEFIYTSLEYNEFIKLVKKNDALIYNHRRQQGVGTLNIALHHGLIPFLRSDNPMFYTYQSWGVHLCDTLQITKWKFKIKDHEIIKNREVIRNKFHPEACAASYNKLFLEKRNAWLRK